MIEIKVLFLFIRELISSTFGLIAIISTFIWILSLTPSSNSDKYLAFKKYIKSQSLLIITLILLLISSFFVYRSHAPLLVSEIEAVIGGESDGNNYMIIIVSVSNLKEPTTIKGWMMDIKQGDQQYSKRPYADIIDGNFVVTKVEGVASNLIPYLREDNFCATNTFRLLNKGEVVRCWLRYRLNDGIDIEELTRSRAILKLRLIDSYNKEHSYYYKLGSGIDDRNMALPGVSY